jgi:polar amino acid transport system ATP-binding protein/sulfate transport system ATP-binding protein
MSAPIKERVILDVQSISITLGGNHILHDLDLRIVDRQRPGQVTGQVSALLGPSGVGKTRLLRIIAGLDSPNAGNVKGIDGKPLAAGDVGVVFQNYPLLRHRTVVGNLESAGHMNGLSSAEAKSKAEMLLDRFGLSARGKLYPAQLSGGQRQRAAIAQQLMKQKTILLLDEPFSGLDPAALGDVIRLLVEVAHMDELNTLVIITHDIRAALIASDTLYLLGRAPDAAGKPTGPAKVRRIVDLVAMGLAWDETAEHRPEFTALERDIKDDFRHL